MIAVETEFAIKISSADATKDGKVKIAVSNNVPLIVTEMENAKDHNLV